MTTMVDWRKVRPRVKKAPLAILVKLHHELTHNPEDHIYRDTVVQLQFDPIAQKSRDIEDLLHGPLAGPYQDSLQALEGQIVEDWIPAIQVNSSLGGEYRGTIVHQQLNELDR